MKLRSLVVFTAAAFMFTAALPEADARPRPTRKAGKRFEANKKFGLGLMVGAPTGLSGKAFLTSDFALDFGIGYIHTFHHHNGLHTHFDFLWHPVSFVSHAKFELPLYVGVGARFAWVGGHRHGGDRHGDHGTFGVRAPIGIAFDFNEVPLDLFFELVFVLDFAFDHNDGHVYGDFNGAIGFRYYFR